MKRTIHVLRAEQVKRMYAQPDYTFIHKTGGAGGGAAAKWMLQGDSESIVLVKNATSTVDIYVWAREVRLLSIASPKSQAPPLRHSLR